MLAKILKPFAHFAFWANFVTFFESIAFFAKFSSSFLNSASFFVFTNALLLGHGFRFQDILHHKILLHIEKKGFLGFCPKIR